MGTEAKILLTEESDFIDTEEVLNNSILFPKVIEATTLQDKVKISKELSKAPLKKMKIFDLKKELILPLNENTDMSPVDQEKYKLLSSLIKNNSKLTLKTPTLMLLNKEMTRKIIRVTHYYGQENFLFKKISSKRLTQSKKFLFGLKENAELLLALQNMKDEDEIEVKVWNASKTLRHILMHAIKTKMQESPALTKPSSATLIMSEECNLRCSYCYEPHGKRNTKVMTFETAKKALRKFTDDARVTFFGGEPMMNVELMKQICEWGWEHRNFSFEMITNGQVIDREFFRNYAKYFSMVQLSCDGPEAPNDINRGHGSFKRIMDFYKAFLEETGFHPTLHPVLSRQSVPYLLEIVKWFFEMEMLQGKPSLASLRWLPGDAAEWEEEDIKEYSRQLDLVINWYLENQIWTTPFRIRAFEEAELQVWGEKPNDTSGSNNLKPLRGPDSFCAAGSQLLAVLPDGTLAPCHHEYWLSKNERIWEVTPESDDPVGINHMSSLRMHDLEKCNTCEQWGCCVCPGTFYNINRSYTDPGEQICKINKVLINKAYVYLKKREELERDKQLESKYILDSIDYLLQKEVSMLSKNKEEYYG